MIKTKATKCTIVVLQTHKNDSNHIRISFCYDPFCTCLQFKSKLHTLLETKYNHILLQTAHYYSEIGIINESISPHDIFEIFEDTTMMECITPNQTVYLYHPSINEDTVLLCDYNEVHDDCEYTPRQSMSISYQSYESVDANMELQQTTELSDEDHKGQEIFFNSQNLYLAYAGNKYGIGQGGSDHSVRTHLTKISHAILIWALRKMDDLWKQKETQDKIRQWLKMHSFEEKVIIDVIIFGNKLTDENVLHLLDYSPWMLSEPKLRAATYDSLSSDHAFEPIQKEQQAIGDQQYVADHPFFHELDNIRPEQPNDIYDVTYSDEPNDPLHTVLIDINQNKKRLTKEHSIKNGPRRWPAHEGLFMYCYQFIYGLCSEDKMNEYMGALGKYFDLTPAVADYVMLLYKSEHDLAHALWKFAEMK